jgi:dTDP-4-dehydrorhamnose 3,5-epimerase
VKVKETALKGLMLIETDFFIDRRGFFLETWHQKRYAEKGLAADFVQDNLSASGQGVLRGLHFQHPNGQDKLVSVIEGEVFDVAVDIRRGSPTYGRWEGYYLSGDNKKQLYVPAGFAHGFCVISEKVLFAYKCTDYYAPQTERGILWNDPAIGIEWPVANPVLSDKDRALPLLQDLEPEHLPVYDG